LGNMGRVKKEERVRAEGIFRFQAPFSGMKVYKGAPHGLCTTLKDQVNGDRLAFLKA
jgi:hypothetical protein